MAGRQEHYLRWLMHLMNTEALRLETVQKYLQLDLQLDKNLEGLAMLGAQIFGVPVGMVTLMDKDVQWIVAPWGVQIEQMPVATSFCIHTIRKGDTVVVEDAICDERFAESPIVKYEPHVRFYAGAPLLSNEGYRIGTFCVMDVKACHPTTMQLQALVVLTEQAKQLINYKMSLSLLKQTLLETEKQNQALRKIAYIQSHEIRSPLTSIMSLINLIKYENYSASPEYMSLMEMAANQLDDKIKTIVGLTAGMRSELQLERSSLA